MLLQWLPKPKNWFISTRAQEIALVILGASALFVVLSLLSYSPNDVSWFYAHSDSVATHNWCGTVGANVAALLFYLFGTSSYLFVTLGCFILYSLLFYRTLKGEWDRLAATFCVIVIVATLSHVHNIAIVAGSVPGGALGLLFGSVLRRLFDVVGSLIFLYALALICFKIIIRFSLFACARWSFEQLKYVLSKDFLVPVAKTVWATGTTIIMPFKWTAKKLYRLLSGRTVQDSEEPLVEFDYQMDDNQSNVHKDEFWRRQKAEKGASSIAGAHSTQLESYEQLQLEHTPEEIASKEVKIPYKQLPEQSEQAGSSYSIPSTADIFIGVADEADDALVMQELQEQAKVLEEKLERFNVIGKVISIKRGPVITLFEYQPEIDSKISKITSLEDDLALALQALSIRIIAPIPGRSVVGFEVANKKRKDVLLAKIIKERAFNNFDGALPLVLGEDTIGNHVIVNLAKMPHLLVAGSTGSGKSVALNTMLISLLCKHSPDQLKLILIDPKRLEFAAYTDIAHLLFPIVTHPKKAAPVLKWVVNEMEKRYEKLAETGVRNIFDFHKMCRKNKVAHEMPFIVVVIDELADLMMTASREVEDLIARITQMARAAGIHMIVATQRPSVDVITGTIKVNFPSRISFRVTSKIDSRTILDGPGAEKLLGRGDMLFLDSRSSRIRRVHGAYVSDSEIDRVADHIRSERKVEYLDLAQVCTDAASELNEADDELYTQVLEYLETIEEVSISLLQRKFRIGYNRSARIIDMLESQGAISPALGGKTRKVIR